MERQMDDETIPGGKLREKLAACLDKLKDVGSYAVFEPFQSMPNPGIVVQGVLLSLPLSDYDAAIIVNSSGEAPIECGFKTLFVHENIKSNWELLSNQFYTSSPEWNGALDGILKKISDGLGAPASGGSIRAEPYKLVLEYRGQTREPYRDFRPFPSKIGTLAIALPSKPDGGVCCFGHGGTYKYFDSSKYSEFGCSYSAWFSEVTHEVVGPIISGGRLVIVYNLFRDSPGRVGTIQNLAKESAKLGSAFSWWQRHKSSEGILLPNTMAYILEHQYPARGVLSYDTLKGQDLRVATHLRNVAGGSDMHICLANVTRKLTCTCPGDCPHRLAHNKDAGDNENKHHDIMDVVESKMSLVRVAELDGSEVPLIRNETAFDESTIIQAFPFEDVGADHEEREACTVTHYYYRTVAIIMPTRHRVPFLFPLTKSSEWLDSLTNEFLSQPEYGCAYVKELCGLITDETVFLSQLKSDDSPSQPHLVVLLAQVLKAAVDIDVRDRNDDLFLRTFNLLFGELPVAAFGPIGVYVNQRPDLARKILPRLKAELSKFPSLERLTAVKAFSKGLCPDTSELRNLPLPASALPRWTKEHFTESVNTASWRSAPNGTSLSISQVGLVSSSAIKVLEIILPLAKSIHSIPMVVFFFLEFLQLEKTGNVRENVAESFLKDVISDLIQDFSSDNFRESLNMHRRSGKLGDPSCPVPENSLTLVERNLAHLLVYFYSLDLKLELDKIIEKICEGATSVNLLFWGAALLPFLKDMVAVLRERRVIIDGSPFQGLFQNVLGTYVERFVSAEPGAYRLSMEERGCKASSCKNCFVLDTFLRSSLGRKDFRGIKSNEIQHLSEQLNDGTCMLENDKQANTFRVSKIVQNNDSHEAWERRVEHATRKIRALGTDLLKDLLEDCYEFVVNFATVRRATTTGITSFNSNASTAPSLQPSEPAWLQLRLKEIHAENPNNSFEVIMEPIMRFKGIDIYSDTILQTLPPRHAATSNITWMYFPNIRCYDCPEMLFTSAHDANFFVRHLNSVEHCSRVAANLASWHLQGPRFSGRNPTLNPKINNRNWTIGRPTSLAGMSFVFAGKLPTLSRQEVIEIIEEYGGEVRNLPSDDTTHMVLGTDASPIKTGKLIKLGLWTINEEALHNLITASSAKARNSTSGNLRLRQPLSTLDGNSMNPILLTPMKRKFPFNDIENADYRSSLPTRRTCIRGTPDIISPETTRSLIIDMTGDSD